MSININKYLYNELYIIITMTNKYNIDKATLNKLYWENEPGWSVIDIAKYYGCVKSLISYYMNKFSIETRDHSGATLNYFECDWKKENHDKVFHTVEHREKMREVALNSWGDPTIRSKMIEGLKKYANSAIAKKTFKEKVVSKRWK